LNEEPNIAVFGDSHAFSAFWGISKSFGNIGNNVKLIGKGSGCLPFINQINLDCRDVINQQIKWINDQEQIKVIFISFRNPIVKTSTENDIKNFEEKLQDTLYEFEKYNKKIVLILTVPEVRMNPRLCVGDMPLGRQVNREQCNFSVTRELEFQSQYRNILDRVLKKSSLCNNF
jgi:hypothetical protein